MLLLLAWLISSCDEATSPTPVPTATGAQVQVQTPTVTAAVTPEPTGSGRSLYTIPRASPTNTTAPTVAPDSTYQQFLPSAGNRRRNGYADPSATATPPPTPTPTIDFTQVRAELNTQGQELGFVKIGFHVGPGGNRNGLGVWMNRLDAAGVPFSSRVWMIPAPSSKAKYHGQ